MSRFIFNLVGGCLITSDPDVKVLEGSVEIDCTDNTMNPDHSDYCPVNTELVFDEAPCTAWDFCHLYPEQCEDCKYRGW